MFFRWSNPEFSSAVQRIIVQICHEILNKKVEDSDTNIKISNYSDSNNDSNNKNSSNIDNIEKNKKHSKNNTSNSKNHSDYYNNKKNNSNKNNNDHNNHNSNNNENEYMTKNSNLNSYKLFLVWYDKSKGTKSEKQYIEIKTLFTDLKTTIKNTNKKIVNKSINVEKKVEIIEVKNKSKLNWIVETNLGEKDKYWTLWLVHHCKK